MITKSVEQASKEGARRERATDKETLHREQLVILILIIAIGLTGLLLKYFIRTNLVDVKAFILGLLTLSPVSLPSSTLFLIHFFLVLLLLIYFPFSKLIHAWGVLMSPTRVQTDTPREFRHVAPWAE
ncbi:MAG: respiratory nitrate reductase subunit gamma [Nitrospiraceae bacterium]|nr:MAG: respiratory nitrate reductase subunit gamma [Nitrospiraceae bacterium]